MKTKLNFRFHDPNPAGVAATYLTKLVIEANIPKVNAALRENIQEKPRTIPQETE